VSITKKELLSMKVIVRCVVTITAQLNLHVPENHKIKA